jgi:hypothetical protein
VRIRYTMTLDDALALQRHHLRHSGTWRRQIAVSRLVVLGVGVLMTWLVTQAVTPLIVAAIPLACAVVGAIGLPRMIARRSERATRRMYAEGRNTSLFGSHEMELGEQTMNSRSDVGGSAIQYRAIEKIVSTDEHTFVYVSAVNAHVIPRKAVTEGDYDAFVAALRTKWDAVREVV